MYANTDAHTHTHTHTHMSLYVHTQTCTHTHTNKQTNKHTHTCKYTHRHKIDVMHTDKSAQVTYQHAGISAHINMTFLSAISRADNQELLSVYISANYKQGIKVGKKIIIIFIFSYSIQLS